MSKTMTPRQMERWANMRARGRTRFVWLVGVCGWGVTVGLAWAAIMAFRQGWDQLPFLLPVALIVFPHRWLLVWRHPVAEV